MTAGNIEQLLTFRIENTEFGIPVTDVYEIIFVPEVTSIAKSPESIIGVINLRGQVIPVIDLNMQFVKSQAIPSRKQRVIVTQSQGKTVGVLVDEVVEVLRFDETNRVPAPDALLTMDTQYINALYKLGQRIIVLLKLEQLLNLSEREFIENAI